MRGGGGGLEEGSGCLGSEWGGVGVVGGEEVGVGGGGGVVCLHL